MDGVHLLPQRNKMNLNSFHEGSHTKYEIHVYTLKMETARSSEMLVSIYQTARCNVPDDRNLKIHHIMSLCLQCLHERLRFIEITKYNTVYYVCAFTSVVEPAKNNLQLTSRI
jgi:hypothetical protein